MIAVVWIGATFGIIALWLFVLAPLMDRLGFNHTPDEDDKEDDDEEAGDDA